MAKVGKGHQICLSWIPASEGELPPTALPADDAHQVFICRSSYEKDLLPGTLHAGEKSGLVCYGGVAITRGSYEVLCCTAIKGPKEGHCWKAEKDGNVPKEGIVAGTTGDGAALYIARAVIDGKILVGKVHDGHKCAYVPHNGREVAVQSYEILCNCD